MTFDVSLEAIEADLRMAETGGTPGQVALYIGRAQVRATLIAAAPPRRIPAPEAEAEPVANGVDINVRQGPDADAFVVPAAAVWEDRVEAAALLLKIPRADLAAALEHLGELIPGFAPKALEAPAEPVEDDDLEDVFAEARKARKK